MLPAGALAQIQIELLGPGFTKSELSILEITIRLFAGGRERERERLKEPKTERERGGGNARDIIRLDAHKCLYVCMHVWYMYIYVSVYLYTHT